MLRQSIALICSFCCAAVMPIWSAEKNSFVLKDLDDAPEIADSVFLKMHWALKWERNPATNCYVTLNQVDTLSFQANSLLVNDQKVGCYTTQPHDSILIILLDQSQKLPFALYPINGKYHYRYHLDQANKMLSLQPLDDWEADHLISVEGLKLRLEQVEQKK